MMMLMILMLTIIILIMIIITIIRFIVDHEKRYWHIRKSKGEIKFGKTAII